MPVHDWTRVDAGIFHAFHLYWIGEIAKALNQGVLPKDHYALPEQVTRPFVPDALALKRRERVENVAETNDGGILLAEPKIKATSTTDLDVYTAKQRVVAVRHVSDDRVVAIVEVVSSGNKSSRAAMDEFRDKAAGLIRNGIHLLIVDLYPPTKRDPHGIHAELWDFIAGEEYEAPTDKPLTQVAYETTGEFTRASVVPVAVGEPLTDMPLFLTYGGCVHVPLEATYASAFEGMPNVSILPLLN